MNDKKEEVKEEDFKNLSFIKKIKTSKKYRSKLELSSYGIFILIVIIFVNVSSLKTNSYNYTKKELDTKKQNETLTYKSINEKYNANIKVTITNKETTTAKDYEINKNYDATTIKKLDNNTEYKIVDNGEFYTSNDEVVEEKEIFDLIPYKYLNIKSIKEYIEKGTVDYTTKYSSGVELTSYKVMIKDLLPDNITEDYITINITTEEEKITIDIDYTNLLKNDNIDTCNVKIIYTNIKEEDNNN